MVKRRSFLIPLLLIIISAASLSFAYIAQYGFGLLPCILCLYQRVPYAVVIAVSLIFLFLKKDGGAKLLLFISGIVFLVGASIAGFHIGVENGWWQGTSDCGGGEIAHTVEELKERIIAAPVTRCDEPSFFFLGLTMAAWNMLYSLALAGICFYFLRKIKNA